MSQTVSDKTKPQAAQDALNFLLPGTLPEPPTPEQLDVFVSSQSLTDHTAMEGVSPFDGVYDIDGLFFIPLDGQVFEVVFDAGNFRYNIILRSASVENHHTIESDQLNREQILSDWHPHYRADIKEWVLLHESATADANTLKKADSTLPYQVDGLLSPVDRAIIASTVERFLLERSAAQPQISAPAPTLLSLLASPHLAALTAPAGNGKLGRKTLSDTLDAMLKSAIAYELATQLLWALEWYGGKDGETTYPAIRQQLVWAALMLELNPPGMQAGHVAGCDLEGPDNWGLTYSQRRARLEAALSLKTKTPEIALYILGPAIPDFMVQDIDEYLRYGSAPWVNFAHGVALANTLRPDALAMLTFEELIQLPLDLTQGATDEQLRLIALTRSLPCVIWARAHGLLQSNAGADWSPWHLETAARALDEHLQRAIKSVEDVTREAPDRRKMALDKLLELFDSNAYVLQFEKMHATSLWERIKHDFKMPSSQVEPGQYYLLDLFATGVMIEGLDKFQPFESIHKQDEANREFNGITEKIKGIDIPAMYEEAFDLYEAKAKAGYAFLIEDLLSRLPMADRRTLQDGRIIVHTLRIWPGRSSREREQDKVRNRGRFGFILECRYQESNFFYEVFPILGLFVRHDRLPLPAVHDPKMAAKIKTGARLPVDGNAYETLAVPESGKFSRVTSEIVLDFAAPEASGGNGPVPLTSTRLKHLAFAVATDHLFFYSQDRREHHRQRTPSEIVAGTYPPILRSLELIIPGLACVNAIAADDRPELICSLEAAPLLGSIFKFLRGTVRLALRAGQLALSGGLPKLATLTPSVLLLTAFRYKQSLATVGLSTSASALISHTLRSGTLNVESLHTLATRMKQYVNQEAGRTGSYSLLASIPSVRTPDKWRALNVFEALGQVNGIKQVPVRRTPDSLSGTGSSYYLTKPGIGLRFGPRLISKKSFTSPQRINNQSGYAMSGRGAMASPIASPNGGTLGDAIDASADLGAVLETNNIRVTQDQLETIKMCLNEDMPVFLYETSSTAKSLALFDAEEKAYRNLLTNAKVYFFRYYNHETLGTWKVPTTFKGGVMQVDPGKLIAGRSKLDAERLASVREAIVEGQNLPPISVKARPDGQYSVVDGNHRLAVARELGLETVPVQIAPV